MPEIREVIENTVRRTPTIGKCRTHFYFLILSTQPGRRKPHPYLVRCSRWNPIHLALFSHKLLTVTLHPSPRYYRNSPASQRKIKPHPSGNHFRPFACEIPSPLIICDFQIRVLETNGIGRSVEDRLMFECFCGVGVWWCACRCGI